MTVDELLASDPELQHEAERHPIAMRVLAAFAIQHDGQQAISVIATASFQLGLQVALHERASAEVMLAALQDFYADVSHQELAVVAELDREEAADVVARVLPPNVTAPPPTDVGACRSCGAAIYWTMTKNGKRAPMNLDPCTDLPLDPPVNHFATCPQSRGWRKGK